MSIFCPCGLPKSYEECCEPFLTGVQKPITPEALMRSRYSAYTKANMTYIQSTMKGKALLGFDALDALRFARRVIWVKLTVLNTSVNVLTNKGHVEFEVLFVETGYLKSIHEQSEFLYEQDQWFYVDGWHQSGVVPQAISRHSFCPCGSGRKFKNCHANSKKTPA